MSSARRIRPVGRVQLHFGREPLGLSASHVAVGRPRQGVSSTRARQRISIRSVVPRSTSSTRTQGGGRRRPLRAGGKKMTGPRSIVYQHSRGRFPWPPKRVRCGHFRTDVSTRRASVCLRVRWDPASTHSSSRPIPCGAVAPAPCLWPTDVQLCADLLIPVSRRTRPY